MRLTTKANKYKKVGKTWPNGPESTFFCIYLLLLCLLPISAFASVQITQVMYDVEGADTGREWIKITNTGTDEVDVSNFRLLEAEVQHKLTVVQGGGVLAPGVSAIIADNAQNFLADTPGYSGILFDSAFSLSNTGETLVLKNATGGVEHSYSYTAPVVEKPAAIKTTATKSASSATTKKTSTSTKAVSGKSLFETNAHTTKTSSLGFLVWIAGLGSVIALGVAGVLFLRQEKQKSIETKEEGDEFTIIDN